MHVIAVALSSLSRNLTVFSVLCFCTSYLFSCNLAEFEIQNRVANRESWQLNILGITRIGYSKNEQTLDPSRQLLFTLRLDDFLPKELADETRLHHYRFPCPPWAN
jgi:hypothetical protein